MLCACRIIPGGGPSKLSSRPVIENRNVALRRSIRMASEARGRSPCQSVGSNKRSALKLAVSISRLERTSVCTRSPFRGFHLISQNRSSVSRSRSIVSDRGVGDAIFVARIQQPQQAANLLPGVGAQGVEIGIPIAGKLRKRTQMVIDVVIHSADFIDLEVRLWKVRQQQTETRLRDADVFEIQASPVHLLDVPGESRDDPLLDGRNTEDA